MRGPALSPLPGGVHVPTTRLCGTDGITVLSSHLHVITQGLVTVFNSLDTGLLIAVALPWTPHGVVW